MVHIDIPGAKFTGSLQLWLFQCLDLGNVCHVAVHKLVDEHNNFSLIIITNKEVLLSRHLQQD